MTEEDQPTTFCLPPRVGIAFNMVPLLKEITTEYEAKRARDMTQHELGCYQSCLEAIRQYVNGEMIYTDTVEPKLASDPLPISQPASPAKKLLGTTGNCSPFIL